MRARGSHARSWALSSLHADNPLISTEEMEWYRLREWRRSYWKRISFQGGPRLILYMEAESAILALRPRSKQLDRGDQSSSNRPAAILFRRLPLRGVLSYNL